MGFFTPKHKLKLANESNVNQYLYIKSTNRTSDMKVTVQSSLKTKLTQPISLQEAIDYCDQNMVSGDIRDSNGIRVAQSMFGGVILVESVKSLHSRGVELGEINHSSYTRLQA